LKSAPLPTRPSRQATTQKKTHRERVEFWSKRQAVLPG
jgi:hypothetical protein